MVTIFDVARAAEVSHQTVSRVLKGDPTVGAVLRERVELAVQALHYRPSAAARALASRRTRTLGLITVGELYYGPSGIAHGFNAAARSAGWDVSIEALDRADAADLRAAVDALASRDVEAMVLNAPTPAIRQAAGALGDQGVPFVMAGRADSDGVQGVAIDQEAGAVAAVEHLLALGHRSIAHVAGPADWLDAQDREAGWLRTMRAAGVAPGPLLRGDWTPASGAAVAGAVIDSGATAVFCANDQMALGLLHALHGRGVAVPGDLSVVGFDDLPESAYFTPALTTVRQDFVALGRGLLVRVEQLIADPSSTATIAALPAAVVVRASTAAFADRA